MQIGRWVLEASSTSPHDSTQRAHEAGGMPFRSPLAGDDLLAAVTEHMAALHTRYHGRPPATAATRMMGDDLMACVLGGVYSDIEKTLIELDRTSLVHEVRSAFQGAMQERFVPEIERLSGRRVESFVSTHSVGPDLEIELFFLAPAA
jgi:uncharacterized protein YbcI